jgi:hypothetical protein
VKGFVVAKTQLRAAKSHNAGAAGLDHFNLNADAHPQFLEPMDFVGAADKLVDPAACSGWKHLQGQEIVHGKGQQAVETQSH